MSATGVTIGYGATIRIGRGAVPAWTPLVGVGDFDFPAGENDEVEVTSHTSPNRTKEYVAGMIDNGTISVPLDYVPESDQDILLRVLRQTGELVQVEVTAAGGDPEIYAGFVRSYGRTAPVQGKSAATLVLRINGIVSGEAVDPVAGA
ncbi:phage tail tube protein [Chachezhania sediminis]|uniref:phage tail tube protein n=1 Tax=Chachezhania sediminis TaxID=2599291 RepID=UPI00131C2592|nr:phage tail tube protein [Chachezhania sediminis]